MTRTRAARDLAWCISSEPLINAIDERWPSSDWFRSWQDDFETETTPTKPMKLGLRFEAIMAHWINSEGALDLLAKNLPVHDGNRTIGEFDLIVGQGGAVEHWELAVKFYLGIAPHQSPDHWFGPNPDDTLHQKIHRMDNHQLRLSQHPAGKALLADKGWHVTATKSLVKGRLFYPLDDYRQGGLQLPDIVNPNHESGWWVNDQTFIADQVFTQHQFVVLDKQHWLAPVEPPDNLTVLSHATMVNKIGENSGDRSSGTVHIAMIDNDGYELSRGFIVFPRWLRDVDLKMEDGTGIEPVYAVLQTDA